MLPELHAERQLAAIEAATVPHMTEAGHQKTVSKYGRLLAKSPGARSPNLSEALGGLSMRRIATPKKSAEKVKTDG